MNPEQWGRLREVFFAVCDAPAAERERVLASLCADNTEMLARVRELLAADDDLGETDAGQAAFLDQPALGRVLTEVALNEVGEQSLTLERIGPYAIVRKLGEGGMGTVFEAAQEHPRRRVAVKVLRPGVTSPQMLRRFRLEADLLARLRHPGIAQIYDAGIADVVCNGQVVGRQPYFAMELIRSTTITEHVRERRPAPREIMQLMSQVADAVQHAHQNGVIHRDLKPANILVDANGLPKVLDFGVARPLDALQTRATLNTQAGQIVGTLEYMSPEQVGGDGLRVDTRSDVYSLGVVTYELLAGRPAHDVRELTLTAAIRIVRDEAPEDLERVNPQLRGDVSRIVTKAIAKERERRYQSAGALADDIRRYLSDQPILARPTSAIYQLRKFARRNKALVGGGVASLVSLLVGIAGIVWFAIGESQARTEAEAASKRAMRLAQRVSIGAAADAIQHLSFGPARTLLESIPPDERRWEWDYLNSQLDNSDRILTGPGRARCQLWFGPDGSDLVAAGDESVTRWNVRNGSAITENEVALSLDLTHVARFRGDGGVEVSDSRSGRSTLLGSDGIKQGILALSPDGSCVAVGAEDGRVLVLSDAQDSKRFAAQYVGAVRALRFGPAGAHLFIQTTKQWVVLHCRTGQIVRQMECEFTQVPDLTAWSHDGSRLYAVRVRATDHVHAIDLAPSGASQGGPRELRGLSEALTELVVSPDNRFVFGCQYDGKIHKWDVQSGEIVKNYHCASSGTYGLALHPSGQWIAAGDVSGLIRTFDVASGNEIGVLRGPMAKVLSIAFSADGGSIAAVAASGESRLWRSDTVCDQSILRGHTSYVYPVQFSTDGKLLASGSWDGSIRLWDSVTGRERGVLHGHKHPVYWLSFSPDGRHLFSFATTWGSAHEQFVWDVETGQPVARAAQPLPPESRPVFSPDGHRIWLAQPGDESVSMWSWETGEIRRESVSALRELQSPWISSDRRVLARFAGPEKRLELVDLASGEVRHTLCEHTKRAVFSPDNRVVVAVFRRDDLISEGDIASVWLVQSGKHLGELRHEGSLIYDVAFSPDGSRIISCGVDKLIHVWDAATLEQIVGLRGHTDYVWSIAWSPDGSTLASGSGDSTVRLWRSNSSRAD